MPKFTIRAHIEPDMETGPGEPDMDDAGGGKKPMMAKKSAQFSLPKSPMKGKPKGFKDGKNNR